MREWDVDYSTKIPNNVSLGENRRRSDEQREDGDDEHGDPERAHGWLLRPGGCHSSMDVATLAPAHL